MKTPQPRAQKRPFPKFKTLRPCPPDDPIYTRGIRVGITVFGKRPPKAKIASQADEHRGEER